MKLFNSVPYDTNYYSEIKNCKYIPIKKFDKYKLNEEVRVIVGDYMITLIGNILIVPESMGIEVDTVKSGVGIIKNMILLL